MERENEKPYSTNLNWKRIAFFAAFIIRFVYCLGAHYFSWDLSLDAESYRQVTSNVIESLSFTTNQDYWFLIRKNEPTLFIVPGYVFLRAILFNSDALIRFFNIIIDLLYCYFIYSITKETTRNIFVSNWTLIICLFYPSYILKTGELMSEPAGHLLLVAALYIFIRRSFGMNLINSFIVGFLIGIAALFRPEILGIGFVLITLLLIIKKNLKQYILCSTIVTIGMLTAITPWIIRNYNITSRILFSTRAAYSFVFQNEYYFRITHKNYDCKYNEQMWEKELREDFEKEFSTRYENSLEIQRYDYMHKRAKSFILENKKVYILLGLKRVISAFLPIDIKRFLGPIQNMILGRTEINKENITKYIYNDIIKLHPNHYRISDIVSFVFFLFGMIGFLTNRGTYVKKPNFLLFLCLVIYYCTIFFIIITNIRIRSTIDFIFIIYSSIVLDKLLKNRTVIQKKLGKHINIDKIRKLVTCL